MKLMKFFVATMALLSSAGLAAASDYKKDGQFLSWEGMAHAAQAGDSAAQLHIAIDNDPRWEQGRTWQEALSSQGNCVALDRWSELRYLESVKDGAMPPPEIVALIRRAAAAGCGEQQAAWLAIHSLTGLWPDARGVLFRPFIEAAEQGDGDAERLACRIATRPNFTDPRLIRFCEAAASGGNADAAYRLARFIENRPDDHWQRNHVWPNREPSNHRPEEAMIYYRKAADLGHAAAQARLAFKHATAKSGRDNTKALQLATQAAKKNSSEGKVVLGLLLLQGRGGELDIERGAELVEQAARAGNTIAHYTMATLYMRGISRPRDFTTAIMWLELSGMHPAGWPPFDESSALMLEPPRRTTFVATTLNSIEMKLEAWTRAIALRRELAASGEWPLLEELEHETSAAP